MAKLVEDSVFDPMSGVTYALPEERNLHELTAETACAFLDIVSPPYDEFQKRDCVYYKEAPADALAAAAALSMVVAAENAAAEKAAAAGGAVVLVVEEASLVSAAEPAAAAAAVAASEDNINHLGNGDVMAASPVSDVSDASGNNAIEIGLDSLLLNRAGNNNNNNNYNNDKVVFLVPDADPALPSSSATEYAGKLRA